VCCQVSPSMYRPADGVTPRWCRMRPCSSFTPATSIHAWFVLNPVAQTTASYSDATDPLHPTRAVLGTGSSATPSSGRGPSPSLETPTVPLMPRLGRLFANERAPLIWGLVWGAIQAASPLGLWWLDAATVYALSLALIASIYIGFAVADGRPSVVAVETTIAGAFVVVAAAGVTGSAWLLVLGLIWPASGGLKPSPGRTWPGAVGVVTMKRNSSRLWRSASTGICT
jgi:hypothetical protein